MIVQTVSVMCFGCLMICVCVYTVFLRCPTVFPLLSYKFPMMFLFCSYGVWWFSYDFQIIAFRLSHNFSYEFHTIFRWVSYEFLWVSYECPMRFLWYSMISLMVSLQLSDDFPKWSNAGPMVLLWCSSAFPMIFVWLSCACLKIILWFLPRSSYHVRRVSFDGPKIVQPFA